MADDDNLTIQLQFQGRTYAMRLGDFTGTDDLAIYQTVGKTIADIFQGDITLFTVAALLWRWRVTHGEPQITFEKINDKMTFDALEIDEDDDGDGETPEA